MKLSVSPISPSAALATQPIPPKPGLMQVAVEDQELFDAFHRMYYGEAFRREYEGQEQILHHPITDVTWLGTRCMKMPFDLMVYQEILWDTRPELIIECGTSSGGTTLFLASICELLRCGIVVTIDVCSYQRSYHPLISWCIGDSLSQEIRELVQDAASHVERVMVILDDDHSRDHVLDEMEFYGQLVKGGCYMVVEDTNINGHPVFPDFGPGPAEAVEEFMLRHRDEWEQDRAREHYGLTYNPGGWMRRK